MSHSIERVPGLQLPKAFYVELESLLAKHQEPASTAVTLNFKDEDYSSELGGYHPVELRFERKVDVWQLLYATDFSYQGSPAYLEKEIDVCFTSQRLFSPYLGEVPLRLAKSLARTFLSNFISYYQQGVYRVELSSD